MSCILPVIIEVALLLISRLDSLVDAVECNEQIYNSSGVISNHGWSVESKSCSYTIYNDNNHVLIFKIVDLQMPSQDDTKCSDNYLHFFPPEGRFCGFSTHLYTSNSSTVSLKFYASSKQDIKYKIEFYKAPKGSNVKSHACSGNDYYCTADDYCILNAWRCNSFQECSDGMDEHACDDPAVPQESCNKKMTSLSGFFKTPNYPHAYVMSSPCEWHIQLQKGNTIQLNFINITLGLNDALVIYDGNSDKSTLIGEYSIEKYPVKPIKSTGTDLFLRFQSSYIHSGKGFNASYQATGYCLEGGDWFSCQYGEDLCYHKNVRCDGIWDCKQHGGDERACGKCPENKFRCSSSSSQCYEEKDRCNGQRHCANNADEMKCDPDNCGPHNGTFLCRNGRCIVESWQCDRANDCEDNSDEANCPSIPSRRVITAAVVGSLLCALLLVIALGCTCRLHAMRMRDIMGYNYVSPVSRVQDEIWARQSAPPLYDEAMQTSRPYDEMVASIEQALRRNNSEGNTGSRSNDPNSNDERLIVDGNEERIDEQLLDISTVNTIATNSNDGAGDNTSIGDDIGASNVELTLLAGASAQWRRGHKNKCGSNAKNSSCTMRTSVSKSDDIPPEIISNNDDEFHATALLVVGDIEKLTDTSSAVVDSVIENTTCDNVTDESETEDMITGTLCPDKSMKTSLSLDGTSETVNVPLLQSQAIDAFSSNNTMVSDFVSSDKESENVVGFETTDIQPGHSNDKITSVQSNISEDDNIVYIPQALKLKEELSEDSSGSETLHIKDIVEDDSELDKDLYSDDVSLI